MSRKMTVLWAAAFVLLVGGGGAAFLLWQDIAREHGELLEAAVQTQRVTRDAENIASWRRFRATEEQDLLTFENLFVNPETPIAFIQFVERSALDSGLGLTIVPGKVQALKEDPWPSLTFQFRLEGPYPQLAAFLEKLEAAPYLLLIERVTIQDPKEGEVQELTAAVKVFTK